MASVEFIQSRIAGKEKEIEKLSKKIERIRKAESTGWTVNPYYYSESDLRCALRNVEEAENSLAKYREALAAEEEKANSRNVPAILEFLEKWKATCIHHYGAALMEYFAEQKYVRGLFKDAEAYGYGSPEYKAAYAEAKVASDAFYCKRRGYYKTVEAERGGRKHRTEVKVKDGEYEWLSPYSQQRTYEEAMQKLKKDLELEAVRKYDFIIERTNAIVGEITDATALKLGEKDDLNGYVIGTRGVASVKTIGAGGYNIQCFHFRTLINRVK